MKKIVTITETINGVTKSRTWVKEVGNHIKVISPRWSGRPTGDPMDAIERDRVKALAKRLEEFYETGANELLMKQTSFIHAHAERVRKYRAMVAEGKMTEEDYRAWMRGQIFQGQAWQQRRDQMARMFVNMDDQALRMIRGEQINAFAEGANYLGFELESERRANLSFGLYDSRAVAHILRDQPDMLPRPRLDKQKDYAWYNKIISDAVSQGILQGEFLEDIVNRIAVDTCEKSMNAIRRNAQTAMRGARNAGQLEGMRQARDKLGIKIKRQWHSVFWPTTREAHARMDGQIVDLDEPFESILGPIMFPGDPGVEPANVYNCQCWVEKVYEDFPDETPRDQWPDAMTYEEWKAMKRGERNA